MSDLDYAVTQNTRQVDTKPEALVVAEALKALWRTNLVGVPASCATSSQLANYS